jgi:tRNA_anti-like
MRRMTIAGVMVLAVSAGCSTKNADPTAEPRQKVEEADKLYAAGNKSEAIALYKQYIDRSGRTREEAYGRIVDFEFSQGNEAEAKSWAKRAVDQTIDPPYQTGQAKELHAQLYADRWGKPMPADMDRAEAVRVSRNIPLPEFVKTYQNNTAVANGQFKNKYLQLWSNSFERGDDPAGKKFLTLKSPNAEDRLIVKCYFRDDAQAAIERVKPGFGFIIIGRGDGKQGDAIVLKHCFIFENDQPKGKIEPKKTEPKKTPDPILVSADTLAQAVQDDVNAAAKKYHLRELQVEGVVSRQSEYKGQVGSFQFDVMVKDRKTDKMVGFTIFCGLKEPLPKGDKRLDEIAAGKKVTVRGRSTAMGNGQVTLTSCIITRAGR